MAYVTTVFSALGTLAATEHSGGLTMSINMDDEKKVPPHTDACFETIASEEEIYLETTEEELRAILTSEPTAANHWRINREKLELGWELETFDDGCK